jgi:hypothetical protein
MPITADDLTGLTRVQAISMIDQQSSWSNTHIKHLLHSLKSDAKSLTSSSLKVGDVINTRLVHPGLILKIGNGIVICCLMTTEVTTEGILLKSNSRFFEGSYLTNTIVIHTIEESLTRFKGVYDCKSDVTLIKKKLKEFYKEILTIK